MAVVGAAAKTQIRPVEPGSARPLQADRSVTRSFNQNTIRVFQNLLLASGVIHRADNAVVDESIVRAALVAPNASYVDCPALSRLPGVGIPVLDVLTLIQSSPQDSANFPQVVRRTLCPSISSLIGVLLEKNQNRVRVQQVMTAVPRDVNSTQSYDAALPGISEKMLLQHTYAALSVAFDRAPC